MPSIRATVLVGSLPFLGAMVGWACGPVRDPDDIGGPQWAALEDAPVTTPAESAAGRANHAIKTAFVIVMENENWSELKGNPSAPYINRVLLPAAASTENYWDNPKQVHPSEPNYIWMEAGDNLGIVDNHPPDENFKHTRKHLSGLLDSANVPWKFYQQGIDGKRCPLYDQNDYEPKHNPTIFFTDITDGNKLGSPKCMDHVRPLTELEADLANGKVSGYVFITPDRCHNMHDPCGTGNNAKNGDDFLSVEIPMIQASEAYKNGGAIFLTWDESEGGTFPIGMMVLSPLARAGYRSSTKFNHSSLLRTMQEIFAVGPLIRDANNATSLGELFTAYP
jgi:hypothetical protein